MFDKGVTTQDIVESLQKIPFVCSVVFRMIQRFTFIHTTRPFTHPPLCNLRLDPRDHYCFASDESQWRWALHHLGRQYFLYWHHTQGKAVARSTLKKPNTFMMMWCTMTVSLLSDLTKNEGHSPKLISTMAWISSSQPSSPTQRILTRTVASTYHGSMDWISFHTAVTSPVRPTCAKVESFKSWLTPRLGTRSFTWAIQPTTFVHPLVFKGNVVEASLKVNVRVWIDF